MEYYKTGALDEDAWTADAIRSKLGLDLNLAKDIFSGCYAVIRTACRGKMEQASCDASSIYLVDKLLIAGAFALDRSRSPKT